MPIQSVSTVRTTRPPERMSDVPCLKVQIDCELGTCWKGAVRLNQRVAKAEVQCGPVKPVIARFYRDSAAQPNAGETLPFALDRT